MSDYIVDVKNYVSAVDETAVAGIVKHLGIALRSKDYPWWRGATRMSWSVFARAL